MSIANMAIQRKESTSPAFRYFIFILCICIFLFAFLLTRLIHGVSDNVFNNVNETPSFRVEATLPPAIQQIRAGEQDHALLLERVDQRFYYVPCRFT